jgi:hypothetical protein
MPAQDAPSTTQKRMPPKGRPVEDSDLRLASDDLCSLYRAASVRPGLGHFRNTAGQLCHPVPANHDGP